MQVYDEYPMVPWGMHMYAYVYALAYVKITRLQLQLYNNYKCEGETYLIHGENGI